MENSAGGYHPPTVVFDDEKTAVAEPLLGEHRSEEAEPQAPAAASTAPSSTQNTHNVQSHNQYPSSTPHVSASTAELQYPAGLDTTTLPDGIASWHEQRNIQILWLISSIVMVVLDVVGLDVGFLAGLLGITGASLAVCNCCQFTDLRGIVRTVRFLGYLTFSISAIIGLLLLGAINGWECNELHDIEDCQNIKYLVLFLGAWHGWHAALSFMVAQRATKVKQLLDPISSGMLII